MFKKYLETIKSTQLFLGIPGEEILVMLENMRPKIGKYAKNDIIKSIGASFKSIGLVLEGEVNVVKENAAGATIHMAFLQKGDIFGEMLIFTNEEDYPATILAKTDCEILFIPKESILSDCQNYCNAHRVFINNLLAMISQRAMLLNKKLEYMSIKSIKAKVATYLLEEYKKHKTKSFTLHLKRGELAQFLNVSRPSMSREMAKMRDEGVIDFHLNAFKVLDFEKLVEIANS